MSCADLQRGGERRDPGLVLVRRLAIAPADHLHPDQPDQMQQQEHAEAGKALLAEHLEIGAVIGAAFVGQHLGLTSVPLALRCGGRAASVRRRRRVEIGRLIVS